MELIESKSERTDLNIDENNLRYASISNVQYNLTLVLLPGETYQGYVEIAFDYHGNSEIFVDYAGQYVKYIKVNTQLQDAKSIFHNQRIFLKDLPQKNIVQIYFVNKYSQSGLGIHHFKDPEDNEEYTYTQFESFFAHDCFPCFDQPDLKATLAFTSIAPSKWQIISNEREALSFQLPNSILTGGQYPAEFKEFNQFQFTLKSFPQTDKISSYLYAFIAGPYDYFEDLTPGFPPMRIFMRKTLSSFIRNFKDEFFYSIKAGIRYYEDFFGVKFPWHKYDQIYCPEYKFGAMENVGAVTFNESRYVFKNTPTIFERTRFVVVILHELAHMWFGDLITMKWWTNLWLNESFATFMSIMALKYADLSKYSYVDPWTHFLVYKKIAFNDDQMPSTHPILNNARTTEEAENSFDGITYGKGASCLKQLCYFIGEDTLREGIQSYFKKYAWKNTTFDDFIGEMQIAFAKKGGDLTKWSAQWLRTSGMNILKPEYIIDAGKVKSFEIIQNMTSYGINQYREHIVDIAFFDKDMKPNILERVKINAAYRTEVKTAIGKEAPAAIFINYNDWAFAKVDIDAESRAIFENNIHKINNELARSQIYRSLYDMCKDAKIKPIGYLSAVIKNLDKEASIEVIQQQMMFYQTVSSHYIEGEKKEKAKLEMMELLFQLIKKSESLDIRNTALSYIPSFISKKEHFDIIINWIKEGVDGVTKIVVPIKTKYAFLVSIYGTKFYTMEEKEKLYQIAINGDKSDEAERLRYSCKAADWNLESKRLTWSWYISKDKKESDETLISSMQAFFQPGQQLQEFEDKFYEDISGVFDNTTKRRFAEAFFLALCPHGHEAKYQLKLKELLLNCKLGEDTRMKLYAQALETNRNIALAFDH